MKQEHFIFGDINFQWGDTLEDIRAQVCEKDIISDVVGEPNYSSTLTVKFSELWGVKTNTCTFEAVSQDRLINSVTFSIPAPFINLPPVVQRLREYLGEETDYSFENNFDSGSVVEACSWELENYDVSTSIYGGIRVENNKNIIGHIFIVLDDIELIDSLYSQPIKDVEAKIANQVKSNSIQIYHTLYPQNMPWSYERERNPNYPSEYLIRALDGLHKKRRFQTPLAIKSKITEFEVGTWQSLSDEYYLSNYWQTVKLEKGIVVKWGNFLPTKFSGICYIDIGDLSISDEDSRVETKIFIEHIEQIAQAQIEYHQGHNI